MGVSQKTQKRRLDLPCRLCGEPVLVAEDRYLQLVRTQERPVCRRNGCHRNATGPLGTVRGQAGLRFEHPRRRDRRVNPSLVTGRIYRN